MVQRFRLEELRVGQKVNQGEVIGQKEKSNCTETIYCPSNVLVLAFQEGRWVWE